MIRKTLDDALHLADSRLKRIRREIERHGTVKSGTPPKDQELAAFANLLQTLIETGKLIVAHQDTLLKDFTRH